MRCTTALHLPKILVQNSFEFPLEYFRNVGLEYLKNENLARIWHFGFELVWSTHPLLENENLAKTWHLDLSWSGVVSPPSKTWPKGLMWKLVCGD